MLHGYARVSTDGQELASQVSALRNSGVRRPVVETASGAAGRPRLELLLARLRPGDVLLVCRVDRLARSLSDLLRVIEAVRAAGAALRSLTEPIETITPVGRLLVQLLGAFAEFERGVIRERCEAGRVDARARGVRFGRPRLFDYDRAAALRARGWTWDRVGAAVGRPGATVRLALARVQK
ncbi:MAG: recombinase family protein [Rubrivivax sp.]|nr:recombinase family protein [Rubrivivax sp.]MDP3613562.1 recombinase family protein [Rubrivivax sp.]